MLFTTLNIKKHVDIKEKSESAFQAIAMELYKQPKETNRKRTPKISNKLCQGRCGCQN